MDEFHEKDGRTFEEICEAVLIEKKAPSTVRRRCEVENGGICRHGALDTRAGGMIESQNID